MIENFVRFDYKVQLNWNLDDIIASINEEYTNDTNSYHVLKVPVKNPYWQVYPFTGTIFSRNFSENYPKESINLIEQLKIIQSTAKESDFQDPEMYRSLINHKFDPKRVGLIKAKAGTNVLPHSDHLRKYVLNIGLRNSNTCTTYVSNITTRESFWQNEPRSFTMQDNEVYMVNVDVIHAVRTNVTADSNLDRYIATYRVI